MGHDATKVLLGTTQSSDRDASLAFPSNPATFKAGLAVRETTAGLLSVTKADGEWIGVSLGRSLSDTAKTDVLRAGLRVPLLLEATPARGVVNITSYANLIVVANDTIKIGATTFTFKASASTESEVAAVTSNGQTAINLAAKINAHSVAGALFVATRINDAVEIIAKNNATTGVSIDLVYTDANAEVGLTTDDITFTGGGTTAADYVVIGAKVYISDTTGKGDNAHSAATVSAGIYVSGVLSGVDEDGNAAACAYVDMGGGL